MAPVGSLRASVVAAAVVVTFVGTPAAAQDPLPAFPGAQGFGAVATGGRAGDVVIVDTLEPYGPGSLGAALDPEDCGPRIVVFRVSGVIEGELDLTCGDLTIAGQTAPGAGITVRGRIDGYGADPAATSSSATCACAPARRAQAPRASTTRSSCRTTPSRSSTT